MKTEPNNYRSTNAQLALHTWRLYGKLKYDDYKDYHNLASLRKLFRLFLKTYESACTSTIQNLDDPLNNAIKNVFERAETRIKEYSTIDGLDQAFITSQSEIIFQLLGQLPDNFSKENISSHPRNWKLDVYRTINYSQTPKQICNSILKYAQLNNENEGLPSHRELKNILIINFKNNHSRFLNWFKFEYPEHFVEII